MKDILLKNIAATVELNLILNFKMQIFLTVKFTKTVLNDLILSWVL